MHPSIKTMLNRKEIEAVIEDLIATIDHDIVPAEFKNERSAYLNGYADAARTATRLLCDALVMAEIKAYEATKRLQHDLENGTRE